MARTLKALIIVIALLQAPNMANAAMAVFDGTAVGKMIEQIKEMKAAFSQRIEMITKMVEQVNILNDVREIHESVSDAIGKVGKIALPITSLASIESQLREDSACLIPEIPAWGIDFNELNTSICERTKVYQKTFFNDEKKMKKLNPVQRLEQRSERKTRVEQYTADAVIRGMAQVDKQKSTIEDMGKTADQLQKALDKAENEMERLHVIAQINLAILRGQNNQTQIHNQMLKIMSALTLSIAVNPEVPSSANMEEE